MNLIKLKCSNCGGEMKVNADLETINCNYCGSKILIDDEATKLKRIEDVKLTSRIKNHEFDIKEKQDNFEEILREKEIFDNSKEAFKKSKISKIILILFFIALICFTNIENIFSKILIVIQSFLLIISWLMGMKYIKEPKNGIKTIFIIIAFALIIPILNFNNSNSNYNKNYNVINWDYIILGDKLPKPNDDKGNIISNSDDDLLIYINIDNEDVYRQYIKECKKYGYVIDEKNDTYSYSARNENNLYLELSYYGDDEFRISLKYKSLTDDNVQNDNKKQ